MPTRLTIPARDLRVGDVVTDASGLLPLDTRTIAGSVRVANDELIELRFDDHKSFRTRPTTLWDIERP